MALQLVLVVIVVMVLVAEAGMLSDLAFFEKCHSYTSICLACGRRHARRTQHSIKVDMSFKHTMHIDINM